MKKAAIAAIILVASTVASEARPRAWCGWYLAHRLGLHDARLNLAANWARLYGSPAPGPCIGCIAVWRHHVGQIVGRTATGWLVHSGNDGHSVRTRERSLRGAVFRR
jgi:hypothetical protein